MVLYLMVGIQGSGKTTWARANAGRLAAEIVSSDAIRNELEAQGRDATDQGDQVFASLEERLAKLLDAGRHVIADATHARLAWRAKELAIARRRGARTVAVWLQTSLAVCRARNQRKPGGALWGERVVADAVLVDMWQRFEPPSVGEFDEVWKVD
jgi:predicted kinase